MYDGMKVKIASEDTVYTIEAGKYVDGVWSYRLTWDCEHSDEGYISTWYGYTATQIKQYLEDGTWTVVDSHTHIKIEVLTAEWNYQGLYKGTIIDNAKVTSNGVEFKHNGKTWYLREGSYLVFKDVVEDGTTYESKSALDKQVSGSHYKDFKIQPVEYIYANNIPFLEANVIKYTSRHRAKNKAADIKKAIHCLELILQMEYGE